LTRRHESDEDAGMKGSRRRFANVAVIVAASGWRAVMVVVLIASLSGCASQTDPLVFSSVAALPRQMPPPGTQLDRQPGEAIVAKLPPDAKPVRIRGRECWVSDGRYYQRRGQGYERFYPYQ
jgi:hypothetical protein